MALPSVRESKDLSRLLKDSARSKIISQTESLVKLSAHVWALCCIRMRKNAHGSVRGRAVRGDKMEQHAGFRAEGILPARGYSMAELRSAAVTGRILEGRALMCDEGCNLTVDLGGAVGFMPREECALGVAEGRVRDIAILTRVGRQVCCRVTGFDGERPLLSRRAVQQRVQEEFISRLCPGDVIDCVVTRTAAFGAFVDVGCGLPSLIPIDNISVSRIAHPSDRLREGMSLRAVVRSREEDTGRLHLTHKELLGTWEQNAALFAPGQTVPGIIRSVESYGVFVELTPNLTGLAEWQEGLCVGETAVVYIKSMQKERMKIKLLIADHFPTRTPPPPLRYFTDAAHISRWRYSPEGCERVVETLFDA